MTRTKHDVIELAMRQCAVDFNCNVDDFKKDENVIVTPENLSGRRHFISGKFFFRMATFGGSAVIAADEKIQPWLKEYVKDKNGHELFEEPHQRAIDIELEKYNNNRVYFPKINKIKFCNIILFQLYFLYILLSGLYTNILFGSCR